MTRNIVAKDTNLDRKIGAMDRQVQALTLRKAGIGYDLIARQLGYRSKAGAHKAVKTALMHTLREPADELRTLEIERLNELLSAIWKSAKAGDHDSIDRVLKIIECRCKMLGLNAVQGDIKIDLAQLTDDQLKRLAAGERLIDVLVSSGTG